MSDKTLAERAAEYMRQRFRAMDVGEILHVDHLAQAWKTLGPGHFAVYIAAEEECERLSLELASVKNAVQEHHDQRGDERCWEDDLRLYHKVLGHADPLVTAMPPDPEAEESCRRWRRQRQCPAVAGSHPMPWEMTIKQLEDEVDRLRALQRDTAVKAEAMHLVLAVMTAKADVSDEKMIGALNQAKAGVEAALMAGEFDPERFGWKESPHA